MKIICIGRNYIDHINEMQSAKPKEPIFFLKPDTALLKDNSPLYYPRFTKNLHYELELVVKISKNGKTIQPQFAHKYYQEITLGIDFTARDLQEQCKVKGLPWEIAKSFDHSAAVGTFVSIHQLKDNKNIRFNLKKNQETVQEGSSNQMIFTIDEIIAYISQFMTLKTGDLIFTGTPAGVGPVNIGDRLIATLEDKELLNFEIK